MRQESSARRTIHIPATTKLFPEEYCHRMCHAYKFFVRSYPNSVLTLFKNVSHMYPLEMSASGIWVEIRLASLFTRIYETKRQNERYQSATLNTVLLNHRKISRLIVQPSYARCSRLRTNLNEFSQFNTGDLSITRYSQCPAFTHPLLHNLHEFLSSAIVGYKNQWRQIS